MKGQTSKHMPERSLQSDKKFIIKGSLYKLAGLATKAIAPFLIILLARLFPQREFGLFVSLQLFTLTLSRFFTMGLDSGFNWFVSKNILAGRNPEYNLTSALWMALIFTIIGYLLIALFLLAGGLAYFPSLQGVSSYFPLICFFSLIPYVFLHILAGALEGYRLPQYKVFINEFIVISLVPLLSIAFFRLGAGVMSLAWGFTLSNLIGALVLILITFHYFPQIRWFKLIKVEPDLLRYSIPLGIAQFIAGLLLRVDLWMVLLLLGPEYSAIYAIMVTLSNGIKTIRQSFDPLIVPVVSRLRKDKFKSDLPNIFSFTVHLITSAQLGIALIVLFLPAEIMSIAGKAYTVEPGALSILLVGNLINGFFSLNTQIIMGLGRTRAILFINLASLLVNILANLLLIPRFQLAGAATATVLAFIFQNLMTYLHRVKLKRVRLYRKYLLVNLAMIIVFGFAAFFSQGVILSLGIEKRSIWLFALLAVFGLYLFLTRKNFQLENIQ